MAFMDIERLNKSQIVLLTLLVSFVTSIATGIVTVSLMEDAPPVIPQTINRVVERTVEKVVPQETQTATVITKEKTVTVKEADLVAQAIARARPSVVRVHEDAGEGVAGAFLSRGVAVTDTYVIAASPGIRIGTSYVIPVTDGVLSGKAIAIDGGHRLALLQVSGGKLAAATLGSGPVVLGQTVVAITGESAVKVAGGIVTGVNDLDGTSQDSFEVDIAPSLLVPGSALLNVEGVVVGLFSVTTKEMLPSNVLVALVKSLESEPSATSTKQQ